jgi:hypothetical protein
MPSCWIAGTAFLSTQEVEFLLQQEMPRQRFEKDTRLDLSIEALILPSQFSTNLAVFNWGTNQLI